MVLPAGATELILLIVPLLFHQVFPGLRLYLWLLSFPVSVSVLIFSVFDGVDIIFVMCESSVDSFLIYSLLSLGSCVLPYTSSFTSSPLFCSASLSSSMSPCVSVIYIGFYLKFWLSFSVFHILACSFCWNHFRPVMIVRGFSVACMPFLCGKQFSQNTVLYAISTMRWWGSLSNGYSCFSHLFFMVLIDLSISGKCWSQAVVFTVMPINFIGILIHSNCLSWGMCLILNPLPWYVLITCCRNFIIVALL